MNDLQERLLDWLWTRLESPEEEVVQAALALSPSFGDLAEELGRYDDRTREERKHLAQVQEDLQQAGALLEAYHEKVLNLSESAAPPEERLGDLLAVVGSTVAIHGFRLLRWQEKGWEPLVEGAPSMALDLFLAEDEALTRLQECQSKAHPLVVAHKARARGRVVQMPTNLLLLPLVLAGGTPGVLALDCGRNLAGEALERLSALTSILNQSRNSEVRLEKLLRRVLQFRSHLDSLPNPLICLDAAGSVCEANEAAEALLGEELEAVARKLRDLPVPGRTHLPSPAGGVLDVELHPLPEGEILALFGRRPEGIGAANLEP